MTIKKDIIYPYFLECCQYCEDSFWESIFEDLSYGITPYGTYISKNFLCCSYKNREFSYKLERKDPKVLYNDIYNLLSEKVGILSQKEKQKQKLQFQEVEKTIRNSRQKWSDIKKKNIKDLLIERYVLEKKSEYNLNIKQTKFLLAIISFALVFKIIINKDIQYEDDKITNIEGVEFTNENIILKKNIFDIHSSNISINYPKKKLSDNWEKFLKQLRKIYNKIS